MRLLVYTGKTPLYNASVKGDILLHMTVYMWGLRGRYFLTKLWDKLLYLYQLSPSQLQLLEGLSHIIHEGD